MTPAEFKEWILPPVQILAAIISPFIAVRLTRTQFANQKLWERKESAYVTLLESLATIEYLTRMNLSAAKREFEGHHRSSSPRQKNY